MPDELRRLIDTVVELPALRFRHDDIQPLARHFARQRRRRDVGFTPAALRTLNAYDWPDNVRQLRQVDREAAGRTDLNHLRPEIFTGPGRPLTRLEAVERDEIIRCLTEPGTTVGEAASELGVSRATIYRKMDQYRITLPRRAPRSLAWIGSFAGARFVSVRINGGNGSRSDAAQGTSVLRTRCAS